MPIRKDGTWNAGKDDLMMKASELIAILSEHPNAEVCAGPLRVHSMEFVGPEYWQQMLEVEKVDHMRDFWRKCIDELPDGQWVID